MASRISQMRNGMPYQQQPSQQQQLNESIERTRALMQQMSSIGNKEAFITNLLQSNPQLSAIIPLLHNGGNLESIATQMAQTNGINLNNLIKKLSGGIL